MTPRPRGFTLVEVLLALALVAILVAAMFALISELGERRRVIGDDWRRWRGTDVLFDGLERDLACVIAGDPSLGAGLKGNESSLTLLTRGVWIDAEATSGESQARHRDLTRVSYGPGNAGDWPCRRTEVLRGTTPDRARERSGSLAQGVEEIRFRYLDGPEWHDSFDSLASGRLPLAVEITVWFTRPSAPSSAIGEASPAPDRTRVIAIPDGGKGSPA